MAEGVPELPRLFFYISMVVAEKRQVVRKWRWRATARTGYFNRPSLFLVEWVENDSRDDGRRSFQDLNSPPKPACIATILLEPEDSKREATSQKAPINLIFGHSNFGCKTSRREVHKITSQKDR